MKQAPHLTTKFQFIAYVSRIPMDVVRDYMTGEKVGKKLSEEEKELIADLSDS